MIRIYLFILFIAILAPAQKNAQDPFTISNKIGFSRYQEGNQFVANANNFSIILGKEFGKKVKFMAGIGVDQFYISTNSSQYIWPLFLNIPLGLRWYYPESTSGLYYGFGIYNRFKISEHIDNLSSIPNPLISKGYNGGLDLEIGYRAFITERFSLLLGINYGQDLFQIGYGDNKTKIRNQVNFSLTFNVSKRQKD